MEELHIASTTVAGHEVLTPTGPIDRVQVDRFRAAMYQAVLANPVVIIDLSQVTLLGYRGAGANALAGHVATRSGCRMVLAAPSRPAAATLRRTGAALRIELAPSVSAAVDRVATRSHRTLEVAR